MVFGIKIRSKSNYYYILLISIFFSLLSITSENVLASDDDKYLGLRLPSTPEYGIPLFTKHMENRLSMDGSLQPILKYYPRSFKRNVQIDSTGQYVTIEESVLNIPLYMPARYSLKEYTDYYHRRSQFPGN